MLKHALDDQVSTATKFHVLFRAKETLVYAPSEKIQEAANLLASHLGPVEMSQYRALHHVRRTFSRWKRSISKRIFK